MKEFKVKEYLRTFNILSGLSNDCIYTSVFYCHIEVKFLAGKSRDANLTPLGIFFIQG